MHVLVKNFLNEDRENSRLYAKWLKEKDNHVFYDLNERFQNYLFKVYLVSYINKTITYSSRNIKRKYRQIRQKEDLCLNVVEEGFNEERVNTIIAEPVDFVEEVWKLGDKVDFQEIVTDKNLLDALNHLTDRQREIIYRYFIQMKKDAEIASMLNISVQAVSKARLRSIKKLRRAVGGI